MTDDKKQSEGLNAQKLQAMLDEATGGGTTHGNNPMLPVIQAQATIHLCALLEYQITNPMMTARAPSGAAGKATVQALAALRKTALEGLAPFARAIKANSIGGQKLKADTVVMQIGQLTITGEDIARAADAYDELWANR